jgi:hypothetical protein
VALLPHTAAGLGFFVLGHVFLVWWCVLRERAQKNNGRATD